MAQKSDWLPSSRQEQLTMARNWISVLLEKSSGSSETQAGAWNIPAEAVTELIQLEKTAADALTVTQSDETRTPVSTAVCKTAFKNLAVKMRDIKKRHFFAPPLTEANLISLGFKLRDTTPTVQSRPSSQPGIAVENTRNRYEHLVKALNRESGSGKPDDAYWVHYGWQVGGKKPASAEDLPKGKSSRKTSLTITYTEVDKGKPVYYACCYENSKGEAGPWSSVEEAFIG